MRLPCNEIFQGGACPPPPQNQRRINLAETLMVENWESVNGKVGRIKELMK